MDIGKTKRYYADLRNSDLCQCDNCRIFYGKVKSAYPLVAEYLEGIGVDIEKPFELWSVEISKGDKSGTDRMIMYPDAQYIVMGNCDSFIETEICGVKISVTESHPVTDIKENHFVIEASSFYLIR